MVSNFSTNCSETVQLSTPNPHKTELSLDKFGTRIGLSSLDKEVIAQKNRIIDLLKAARIKLGLSQGDVAKRLGTHQPAIARMESGYVGEISFDFLIRVALALRVSIELAPLKKAA